MPSSLPPQQPRPPGALLPEALLYIEDGRVVRRVTLSARTTLGAAPDSTVAVAGGGIQPLHAEIHWKNGAFWLVPRVAAPVWVSDRPIAGAVALAHTDRIRMGEVTLLFAQPPADNRTAHKTYVVVRRADGYVFHWAAQQARIRVGRTHGDLLVADDGLPGRHFLVESWGPDAIFVLAERESAALQLYGESLRGGCRRVWNGGVVVTGTTHFAIYGRPRDAAQAPPWSAGASGAGAAGPGGGRAPTQRPAARPTGGAPPTIAARPGAALSVGETQQLGPVARPPAPAPAPAPCPVEAPITAPVPPQRRDDAVTRETSLGEILGAGRRDVGREHGGTRGPASLPAAPSDERPTSEVSLLAIEQVLREVVVSPVGLPARPPRASARPPDGPERALPQDLVETAFVAALDEAPRPVGGTPPRGLPGAPSAAPRPPSAGPGRLTVELQRRPLDPPSASASASASPETGLAAAGSPPPAGPPRVASPWLHGDDPAADASRAPEEDGRYRPEAGSPSDPGNASNTARLRALRRKDGRYLP